MSGKARVSKWRARQVAEGGKPIGVTLTAGAALALESLQASFQVSQREAISLALEIAAGHPELWNVPRDVELPASIMRDDSNMRRMEELEQRLVQLEAVLAAGQEREKEASPEETSRQIKEQLITFTARMMMEHGERMSRVQLYALARQHDMPVPPTQHEYNGFISYNMELIREMMRSLKERTH